MFDLKIDNNKQTIQGVHIVDPKMFADLRLVVQAECFEGWKPTKQDIEELLKAALNPDKTLLEEYYEVFDN